jgi:hypothetical protein
MDFTVESIFAYSTSISSGEFKQLLIFSKPSAHSVEVRISLAQAESAECKQGIRGKMSNQGIKSAKLYLNSFNDLVGDRRDRNIESLDSLATQLGRKLKLDKPEVSPTDRPSQTQKKCVYSSSK